MSLCDDLPEDKPMTTAGVGATVTVQLPPPKSNDTAA